MTFVAQIFVGRSSANMTDTSANRQRDRLGSSSTQQRDEVVKPVQRPQGRPTRCANDTGLQRIVNGMRNALRSRRNIHVTRKDIAQFAGVTPALVTYYFPEKDSLIEAATVPIVAAMVEAVKTCLSTGKMSRKICWRLSTYCWSPMEETQLSSISSFLTGAQKPVTFPISSG